MENKKEEEWVEDTPLEIKTLPADKGECFTLISWLVTEINKARELIRAMRKNSIWTPSALERVNMHGLILHLRMGLREAWEDADELARGLRALGGGPDLKNHDLLVSRRKPLGLDSSDKVFVWRGDPESFSTDLTFLLKKEDITELHRALSERVEETVPQEQG